MKDPSPVVAEATSQAAELQYQRLIETQAALASTLAQADQRENDLLAQLTLAENKLLKRQTDRRMEPTNAGRLPAEDSELDTLAEEGDAIRAQLRTAKADVQETRALAQVVQREITARAASLDGEVTERAYAAWRKIKNADADARLALVRAILAYCGTHTTAPSYVNPLAYVSEVLNRENALYNLLNETVAAERQHARAEAIEASEGMLG